MLLRRSFVCREGTAVHWLVRIHFSGNPCELNRPLQHHLNSRSDNTSPRALICRAELDQNPARVVSRLT